MKRTIQKDTRKNLFKKGINSTGPDETNTSEADRLKPTGIKVEEKRGHQTLRGGFFQTRHTEKK